jgi:hypothetical protein
MVTYLDLRDSQPARLGPATDAWEQLARDVKRLEGQVVGDLTRPLRTSGWLGDAADAAFRICDSLDDEFELAAQQLANAAAVIRHARAEFVRAQDDLRSVVGSAQQQGMRVDDRGVVHPPELRGQALIDPAAQQAHQQLVNAARAYTQRIRAILTRASDVDRECSRVLSMFSPHTAGQMAPTEWRDANRDARAALDLVGRSERDIPPAGATPQAARTWWQSLTDEQRTLYSSAHPGRVGALDGLAAPDRHSANTMALRNMIEEQRAPLPSETTGHGPQRLINVLDRLEASEYGPQAQQQYLLGIDHRGDGQAIVSVGNPDSAKHVGVLVPGIRTTLDDMGGQIDRAAVLRQTADDLTPNATGDVAVVAWLGYDTPGLFDAPSDERARAAAPVLDRFVDGLHASQTADGERRVVAHSYGSTVVGVAASQGNGLAVHDIVVAGSPGMRVPDAGHLQMLPGGRVWAGAADNDAVTQWGPLAHGRAPHTDAFGAMRFQVDTEGHSGYWRPGSESLRNQAWILLGQYDRVTLEDGTRVPAR